MEANQHHQTPARRTTRVLRMLTLSVIGLIAVAGSASAQLGGITGALPATPDVNGLKDTATSLVPVPIPVIDQRVDTPLGFASIYADEDRVAVCHALYAALPMPILINAAADSAGCVEADLDTLNATVSQRAAGQQLDANVDASQATEGKLGAWGEFKGFVSGAIDAGMDLF